MTAKITPIQAAYLCRLIEAGREIGVDSEGDIVFANTKLSEAMDVLGMRRHINWDGKKWEFDSAVAMLRDWADALEKINDQNLD